MAGSINKVILIGHVGNDPEVRSFNNGGKVCNFSIATSESWKDKQTGEKREKTEWHRIAIFNEGLVGIVERYVKKGSKLYIEGKLQTRKWQNRDGNDQYTTEIVLQGYDGNITLLDGRNNSGSGGSGDNSGGNNRDRDRGGSRDNGGNNNRSASGREPSGQDFDLDDDIPF